MAPSGIPKRAMRQDNIFFSSEWSRVMDSQFISILLQLKEDGYWTVGKKNERACARAIGMYNVLWGTNFDVHFGLERVRKLHKRYKVFTWIIQRPWVIYDPSTHSVSCQDTVWKVLFDQEMLVAPYINEGEHSYDALKLLFQLDEPGNTDDKSIIDISSDNETFSGNTSSVVEIANPYGSTMTNTHCSGGSSLNTDSIFFNELAWNYSDSDDEESRKSYSGSTRLSGNDKLGKKSSKGGEGRLRNSGGESSKGQSSCASWSPFKK